MNLFYARRDGKENTVYGVRWTKRDRHAVEYVFFRGYAFGRVWDTRADSLLGHWFNYNPVQVKEMKRKLDLTPLHKTVTLDMARLNKIRGIGTRHRKSFIKDREYITLVDSIFEECGSWY